MTATAQLRSDAEIQKEMLDLFPLSSDARRVSPEMAVAIKKLIAILSLVLRRQPVTTRAEINGHAYTPLQNGVILDGMNWLEGAEQPAPSAMMARLAR